MSKYDEVYFVGDNQAINLIRIGSSKTRNRGAFSGSLAALVDILESLLLKVSEQTCLSIKNCCVSDLPISKFRTIYRR